MSSGNSVIKYLEELPLSVMQRHYESPATCLSIFRLLSSLAKFYVMSMVFDAEHVSYKNLDDWINGNGKAEQAEAFRSLRALHILGLSGQTIRMNPVFKKSFKNVLTGTNIGNSFGVVCDTEDSHRVNIDFLDRYASNRWETILHFMVGTELDEIPNQAVLTLLKHSGLMEGKTPKAMTITNEGFQFLLQDVNAQLWTLLLQYLRMSATLQMDPVDVLNFIFMLGSLELGKDYSLSALSETQVNMLGDLRDYGLIYQRKSTSRRFYPTRLATTLTSDASTLRSASAAMNKVIEDAKEMASNDTFENAGTIIIETNFKLYAYTNSPLQIAVLNLFVHLKQRFANLVTGQITRESIRRALLNGITADQIIAYLETHAHPQLIRSAEEQLGKKIEADGHTNDSLEILQPTIKDQIKLWQLELDRIVAFKGTLFTDFTTHDEYERIRKYTEEIGCLLWYENSKRKLFVTEEGKTQVIMYAKRVLKKE